MFVKQWRRQRHQEQLPQGAFNLRGGILVPVLSLLGMCLHFSKSQTESNSFWSDRIDLRGCIVFH